ncbi:MAG TPA: tetratricopeptide repeat protein [Vicinamibacteria bacterium]|nr:tetratricopeptide repeat protein [Vicinamibacteria bacterium]
MTTRIKALALVALVPFLAGAACTNIKAKAAFKDGIKFYKEENYKKAIESYQRAVELNPNYAEAWFYLGSSQQALYRPGKPSPENQARLEKAIEAFKKSLETNDLGSENLKKVKFNALGALTSVYSDEPFKNYDAALGYAQQLIQDDPDDAKNLYALANLYEKFEKYPESEATYKKVFELNPGDAKACGALAAFYNKPLWGGKSKFELSIDMLQKCADMDPANHEGYQKVATFYWNKAYRDPDLTDAEKDQYADKGLVYVDKALALKADYFEALIYKNLLYRVKANVTRNPKLRSQYQETAIELQKKALEIKKQQDADRAPLAPPPAK